MATRKKKRKKKKATKKKAKKATKKKRKKATKKKAKKKSAKKAKKKSAKKTTKKKRKKATKKTAKKKRSGSKKLVPPLVRAKRRPKNMGGGRVTEAEARAQLEAQERKRGRSVRGWRAAHTAKAWMWKRTNESTTSSPRRSSSPARGGGGFVDAMRSAMEDVADVLA